MKRTNKKGFTLVELVIVIAIIAILAAVLIPTFSGVVEKANQSKATQAARNAYTELLAEEEAKLTVNTTYTFQNSTNAAYAQIYAETGVESITVKTVDTTSGAVTKLTATVGGYTVTYDTTANPLWSAAKNA